MSASPDISQAIQQLQFFVQAIPTKLSGISHTEIDYKPTPAKWSKKEILGHLVDSAANNHQRFIRAQYETIPSIFYDQNKWNELNCYQQLNAAHIIELWTAYNRHLLEVISRIPKEHLSKECNTGGDTNVTLAWLIEDYVKHMEHHLKEIIEL